MRIPLKVSGGPGVVYENWPVTQGIPFAEGALKRGTPVRVVDDAGTAYPTQAQCLSTWKPDLEDVRWLLIDTQLDHSEDAPRQYFLECGEEPPPHDSPIVIGQEGQYLTIHTGPLYFEIRNQWQPWLSPNQANLFGRCRVLVDHPDAHDRAQWREVFSAERSPECYIWDGDYNEAYSGRNAPAPSVTIEDNGPLHVSVCIRGYHAFADTHDDVTAHFCPFILRLHFYAGKRDVRLFHTFIFDQDPHRVALKNVGLNFQIATGGSACAAIGADRPGQGLAHFRTNFEELKAVQMDCESYEVKGEEARGYRMPGWASLSGHLGGMAVSVKDSWQEFPKGFGIAPDMLDVQIWPADSGSYDMEGNLAFTSPFEEPAIYFKGTRDEAEFKRLVEERPTAPLNLKSLGVNSAEDLAWCEEMLEKYAQGRTATYNDTGLGNGTGAAKTTEMLLRFHYAPIAHEDAAAMNAAVQEPLIAPADPAYACATGAFGHFHHAGEARFAHVDAGLDQILDSVAIEPIELCKRYGMMTYGNMVCSHSGSPTVSYVAHKDTDPDKALALVGPYNNEANDQIMAVWGHFLRTGRREHLFLAQRYSRAVADVATVHAHPSTPGVVGLMHYHNAHQWSGGLSPSHTMVQGYLTDYYVTGNRRLLEVAREAADWAVRNQEPSGIISNRQGSLHREFTGPLWNVIEVYRATWEARYGDVARRSLNWLLRICAEKPGFYPVSVYTRGERGDEAAVEPFESATNQARDTYNLFESALRLFDSKTLRDHIVAEVDQMIYEELADNFVTAEMARTMLTPRSEVWEVKQGWYWTGWGVSGNWLTAMAALAYDITGDLTYAAYCRYTLDEAFKRQAKRCRHYADWRFTWLCFGSYIPRLMRVVADAEAKDPAGLDAAEAEWKAERERRGKPAYYGPGVDLDKDTMSVNGAITNRLPADIPREAPPRKREPVVSLGVLSTDDHPPAER